MKKNYIIILCICFAFTGCGKINSDNSKSQETLQHKEISFDAKEQETSTTLDEAKDTTKSKTIDYDNTKNATSQSDKYELSDSKLQEAIYNKYYSQWSDEEMLLAIEERNVYRENCSFYQEVQEYMETVREVTDIAYIIEPLYSTDMKYYEESDFENTPDLIIRLAKNEIYARRGYIFKDEDLSNYFRGQLWYTPTIGAEDFDTYVFNSYEKSNLELLAKLAQ